MAELAAQARFVNKHWPSPVEDAHGLSWPLTFATFDHYSGLVRLLSYDPVPFFACQVLARAALDAAGLAYWLTEPVAVEARVQRGQAALLQTVEHLTRAPTEVRPQAKAAASRVVDAVQAGADLHGWSVEKPSSGRRASVGVERVPSPQAAIRHVLDHPAKDPASDPDEAGPLWWLLSGYTHSALDTLSHHLDLRTVQSSTAFGVGEGRIILNGGELLHIISATGRAVRTAMDSFRRLFGAEIPDWERVHDNYSHTIIALLQAI